MFHFIQRSRERLKKVRTKILNLFKPFGPLGYFHCNYGILMFCYVNRMDSICFLSTTKLRIWVINVIGWQSKVGMDIKFEFQNLTICDRLGWTANLKSVQLPLGLERQEKVHVFAWISLHEYNLICYLYFYIYFLYYMESAFPCKQMPRQSVK